jgi:hypothetical protein
LCLLIARIGQGIVLLTSEVSLLNNENGIHHFMSLGQYQKHFLPPPPLCMALVYSQHILMVLFFISRNYIVFFLNLPAHFYLYCFFSFKYE